MNACVQRRPAIRGIAARHALRTRCGHTGSTTSAWLGCPFSGGRRLAALGLQQLLALVILEAPGVRTGFACLVRQLLGETLATDLLDLRAKAAADVEPVRGVVLGGKLCGGGATTQADAQ